MRILVIFLITSLMLSCVGDSSDGTYCASIERYNPKTTKQSSYTLTVKLKKNKLVQINWPNGGHSDEEDFRPPSISNKKTSFSDYSGTQYKVELIKKSLDCFESDLKQCSAITKKGKRCQNKTGRKSGICWHHD